MVPAALRLVAWLFLIAVPVLGLAFVSEGELVAGLPLLPEGGLVATLAWAAGAAVGSLLLFALASLVENVAVLAAQAAPAKAARTVTSGLERECPLCHTPNKEGARYCQKCGTPFTPGVVG